MKRIFIIIFCALIATSGKGQSTYYYALELNKLSKVQVGNKFIFKEADSLKLREIFREFTSQYQLDMNSLYSDLKESNPYFGIPKNAAQSIATRSNNDNAGLIGFVSSSLVSSTGGLNITTLADGFAKFIVKRTKQELSTAFFDQFQDDIDKYPDLKTVFPQTARTLSSIGEDIYMYEIYLQTLRESFNQDLSSLPTNLPRIIENNSTYFENRKGLKAELLTAFYIAQSIQENNHPGEMIERFNVNTLNDIPNAKAAFKTLKLFSTSLKSNNDSAYWISAKEVNTLLTDKTLFNIYLGLVLQQAKNDSINFVIGGDKLELAEEIVNSHYVRPKIEKYISFISNISSKAQAIDKQIVGLKKIKNDSLLFENYYTIVTSSLDLMKYTTRLDKLPGMEKAKTEETTKSYFDFAQTTSDIVIDVHRRNYSSAIVNVSYLAQSIDTTFNSKGHHDIVFSEVSQKLLKYGTFMAVVANAKNSDEVSNAIEAIALPAGSSRIKRESAFNVSLNSYCGLFVGQNRTKFWSAPEYSTGITAPIGLAVSWGHSFFPFDCKTKKGCSTTIFASIVDIGALASYRFSNSVDSVPKFDLRDIISPGLFISWGISKCPISINLGCQMAPLLTAVSVKGNTFGSKTFRFTLSACVDLPMLNLYNKSR